MYITSMMHDYSKWTQKHGIFDLYLQKRNGSYDVNKSMAFLTLYLEKRNGSYDVN